jgi:hypothetical protein
VRGAALPSSWRLAWGLAAGRLRSRALGRCEPRCRWGLRPLKRRPAPPPRRWPTFTPIIATNYTISYTHWGTLQPQGLREPNAFSGLELCAGANGSQFYGGAWGWSDENCGLKAPFVCKIRGWRCAALRCQERAAARGAGCLCGAACPRRAVAAAR